MSALGLEVTVVGAGIAGLTCAVALAQRGARVSVHEQAPEISEVGAGLQISPNGVAVLDALGLGPAARAASVESTAVALFDQQGRPVTRMKLPKDPRPFLLIHRAALIEVLLKGAQAAGVKVITGSKLQPPAASDDPADQHTGSHLTIGADGLHSWVRQAINPSEPPKFTGQVAWRAVITDPDTQPEAQVYMGQGRHLVTYPLAGGLRNIVAVEERQDWADEGWSHRDDPANLRRAFSTFPPHVRGWLDRVETVHLWGLHRHPVATHWHKDNQVIVGDAAHPTLPFLAQGAVMALEDAWVLADCLATQDVGHALALYQSRRRARVVRVIEAANANARNYHLGGAKRLVAHAGLRALDRVAPGFMLKRFEWLYGFDPTA